LAAVAAATAPSDFNEMTITQLKGLMASGQARSTDLVNFYLRRIQALDQGGPMVNSVLEVNPDALAFAQQLDAERQAGQVRGRRRTLPPSRSAPRRMPAAPAPPTITPWSPSNQRPAWSAAPESSPPPPPRTPRDRIRAPWPTAPRC